MLLKRVFEKSNGQLVLDPSGQPVLDHVKVLRSSDQQHFSIGFVEKQISEGLVSMSAGKMILHTQPELRYRIVRGPGLYCCHCDAPVDDGPSARAHIEKEHAGAPSPDPSNPAGYRRDNFYACVKEA